MKRGIRPASAAEQNCALEGSDLLQWDETLSVLEGCLAESVWQDAACRVVLSNHWVRYALVPWSDTLNDQAEREQHARYCLSKTYGDVAFQWTVTLNEAIPGEAQIACAIPSQLLADLENVTRRRGLRVVSIQPQLVAAYNGWRDKLPKRGAWFVTLEDGSMAAAHLNDGGWDSVRAVRIGEDWEVELKRLQTFGRLVGNSEERGRVFIDAPRWFRDHALTSDGNLEWLDDALGGTGEHFGLLQRIYA
jgi:hypothetical protein